MKILHLLERTQRRDRAWLMEALQAAVELELFTMPPYLIAMWSIKDETSYAARTLREIVYEEMEHMALACNLLAAIGGAPRINRAPAIPVYPGPMPGGVCPDLSIGLSGLTPDVVRLFMQIERPEDPTFVLEAPGFELHGETFTTIGAFYETIRATFHSLEGLRISVDHQISGPMAPRIIEDLDCVDGAIHQIRVQGEGTMSPLCYAPDLAHYYRFQELEQQRRLLWEEQTNNFRWADHLPFPDVYPVAPIPAGGYRVRDVAPDVAALLHAFDDAYTHVLDELQSAWGTGGQAALWRALEWMFSLRDRACALMEAPIPGTEQRYGPCFRYLGTSPD
jgi:Ferritin-like